jgi:hypothetical protein
MRQFYMFSCVDIKNCLIFSERWRIDRKCEYLGWRTCISLCKELWCTANSFRIITLKGWVGRGMWINIVECIQNFVSNTRRKTPLEKTRCRWTGNIKMGMTEVQYSIRFNSTVSVSTIQNPVQQYGIRFNSTVSGSTQGLMTAPPPNFFSKVAKCRTLQEARQFFTKSSDVSFSNARQLLAVYVLRYYNWQSKFLISGKQVDVNHNIVGGRQANVCTFK